MIDGNFPVMRLDDSENSSDQTLMGHCVLIYNQRDCSVDNFVVLV